MAQLTLHLLFLLLVVTCDAELRCIDFDSKTDIYETVAVCDESCLKIVVISTENGISVLQSCGPNSLAESLVTCKSRDERDMQEIICICRGDYCNSAIKPNIALYFTLLAIIVHLIFNI
ncbi:uncharacterized protein [Palaemon carinicauda]|uniref:uncharacterized protein n=1 Tax=Palaemon carinicauda TaxID=392227 RepID=UPI0035B5718B